MSGRENTGKTQPISKQSAVLAGRTCVFASSPYAQLNGHFIDENGDFPGNELKQPEKHVSFFAKILETPQIVEAKTKNCLAPLAGLRQVGDMNSRS